MTLKEKLPLGIDEIKKIVPHREPFLFLDEIIEYHEDEKVVGLKHVTGEESFFQGHFPGRPIMPGVLILEALAQLGVVYAKFATENKRDINLLVFSGAHDVRFRKQVVPGDTLRLEMSFLKGRFGHWKMNGVASVGDEKAAEAILLATEIGGGSRSKE
jgi:3-hydroxyacyl-[acyl-carrier-protein] dehydratase